MESTFLKSLWAFRDLETLLVIPVNPGDSSSLFCIETKEYVLKSHILTSAQSGNIDLAIFKRIHNLFNIVFTIIDIHNFISSKNVDNDHFDIGSIGSALFTSKNYQPSNNSTKQQQLQQQQQQQQQPTTTNNNQQPTITTTK
ncbi:hypothetical protein ACTA71_002956 [Dictyostelium dimigraforme]